MLVDSGTMENFVDVRMVEWWGMLRKTLPRPQPIINVDRMENKAGMVMEACILEVLHNGHQHLQQFYVTDLGINQVLLGYLWLSTFNPQVNWKQGIVEGMVMLKTVTDTWQ